MTSKSSKKAPELSNSRVKLSFKRHFLPPLLGLFIAVIFFGFLNSQLLAARLAYYWYDRRQAVTETSAEAKPIDKNAPSRLIISKIKVEVPIIFGETSVDERSFQKALQNGVVHYPQTALPSQKGNVVIFGHSSGQWWAKGNYKFIFTMLDKLEAGDKIYIEYRGVRYIYRVTGQRVVLPTEASVLNPTSNYKLTLITCTPVGTNAKRLIIDAEQIAPVVSPRLPAKAESSPLPAQSLPGSNPSFWSSLKELF